MLKVETQVLKVLRGQLVLRVLRELRALIQVLRETKDQ